MPDNGKKAATSFIRDTFFKFTEVGTLKPTHFVDKMGPHGRVYRTAPILREKVKEREKKQREQKIGTRGV